MVFHRCQRTVAQVPLFIGPIVLPVLPVTGEPLDIFKDWLFVGLALSRRTCLSCVFAVIAIGILLGSNIHMPLGGGQYQILGS